MAVLAAAVEVGRAEAVVGAVAGAGAVAVAGAVAGAGAVAVAGAVAGAGAVTVAVAVAGRLVGHVPEHGCVRSGGGGRSVGRSVSRVPQHRYGYGWDSRQQARRERNSSGCGRGGWNENQG